MVKKIIACSDLHIRNLKRIDEISYVLENFINECKNIVSKYGDNEVRIVIAGDIFESKIDVSNEATTIAGWFFRELDKIAKTIVIAGNHDLLINNLNRLDSLSPIFSMSNFNNCIYLDKVLNYESGYLVDDNIVWCLYSSFDNFSKPNFDEIKSNYPNNVLIGLYHGDICGSKTDVGYISENGINAEYFSDLDFGILGHIHKRQCIKKNGVQLVYCGSLIQKDFGENVYGHGFVLWDVSTKTYECFDIENNNNFYQFKISNIDDIDNDFEEIINL